MLYKEPWEHFVYDHFFPEDMFQKLKSACLGMQDSDISYEHSTGKRYNYSAYFDFNGNIINYHNKENIRHDNGLEKIMSIDEIINIHSYVLPKVLEAHSYFSPGMDYNTLSLGFQKITKNYVAVPHVDGANKLLSFVNYVSPYRNIGTDIMIDSMNVSKTVKWWENRTLIFKRKENVTWHNFRSDNFQDRIIFFVNLY